MTKLAIHGGEKLRSKDMPAREAFGDLEIQKLNEVINFYRKKKIDPPYSGIFEKKFCEEFVEFMGGEGYADAVTSGTAAIYTSLQALNLPKRSEVLITAVTDSGPLNCIIQHGLKPKIVDTAKNSYNSCVGNFLNEITDKTKCVIATHAAGESVHHIDKLYEILKEKKIFLIEDCSQSPGAIWNNKKIGSYSDISAFSTMYRKTLHSGGNGGLVYTKDEKLYKMLLASADKGKQVWRNDIDLRNPNFSVMPALNFTTNDLACAIGSASLSRLQSAIDARLKWTMKFSKELIKTKTCYPYNLNENFSIFFFPVFVRQHLLKCSKKEFADALLAEGIGLQPHYGCVISDWQWAADYMDEMKFAKNATEIRDNSFNLFVNEKYSDEEIKDIINAIIKVEDYYLKDDAKKDDLQNKLECCGFPSKCTMYG
jgi:perosamine synthetase